MARTTMRDNLLPKMYEDAKKRILECLQGQKSLALTIDIWTDRTISSFLGVTGHLIKSSTTADHELLSELLHFKEFSTSHTGENIAAEIEDILKENSWKDKVSYIVTDNAANMKAAFSVISRN